ncbi:MAG: 23S rRNA pseudouridine(955/2504/2580) synthase RluC [Agarilytica sp.]
MSSKVQFLTISADEAGQRLDNFLLRILKGAPKSLIYRVIRKGEVRINKGRAKPERKLQAGDIVRVPPVRLGEQAPVAKPSEALENILEASILYEDSGLLIVNKPSGLAVHGGSGINLGLVEALRQTRDTSYLELVHRLDRDTSGCIILAKKRSVLRQLHEKLRADRGIDKQYLALVKGHWSNRRGSVDVPLKKNELKSGERIVRVDPEGKASKTLFHMEEQYSECSLVRAKPITGRTHQIRVHAQHAKHPLVGDEKYGDDAFNKRMRKLGFKRLFLHASSLSFTLNDGKSIEVHAPLPNDLASALKNLSSYASTTE